MIRHRTTTRWRRASTREAFAFSDDTILLYLPLAHNFGRLMHLLGAHVGYTIAFCADPLRIAESLPVVRPTLLPAFPASTRRCTRPSRPSSRSPTASSAACSTSRWKPGGK